MAHSESEIWIDRIGQISQKVQKEMEVERPGWAEYLHGALDHFDDADAMLRGLKPMEEMRARLEALLKHEDSERGVAVAEAIRQLNLGMREAAVNILVFHALLDAVDAAGGNGGHIDMTRDLAYNYVKPAAFPNEEYRPYGRKGFIKPWRPDGLDRHA